MDGIDFLITLGVVVVAFGLWVVATALTIWGERRILAKMQSRIGPNRLGPFGVLQSLADGVKMFFKEDLAPTEVDRVVYFAAPAASAIVALLTFAVVPFGGSFTIGEREVTLQVWDPPIGMLWILAMSAVAVYGVTLGGWASGSKYPLLGGVRSTAQLISYELALSLGLASVFVWTGTLQASGIVEAQQRLVQLGPISLPAWNILPQLPAFALFFIAALAESERPPFDLPEGEGELVAGFHTEYSGARFAMFMLAEFMGAITMSAIIVTLFFGGPGGPLFGLQGTLAGALLGFVYFALKVFVFVFVLIWLRGTLPRLNYNRLMDLGWKVLLPIGLVWVLGTATIVVAQETLERTTVLRYALIAAGVVVLVVLISTLFTGGPPPEEEPPPDTPEGPELPATSAAAGLREAVNERTPDRIVVKS